MTETQMYEICGKIDAMDYKSNYIPTVDELIKNQVEKNFDKYKEYLLFLSEKLGEKGPGRSKAEREVSAYINKIFSEHLD